MVFPPTNSVMRVLRIILFAYLGGFWPVRKIYWIYVAITGRSCGTGPFVDE